MRLKIVCVGNRPPEWLRSGIDEYAKRFPKTMNFEIQVVPAAPRQGEASRIKRAEADKILRHIDSGEQVVLMDEGGKQVSSMELAQKFERWRDDGARVAFLIGGADGFDERVRARADETLALSRLTLPHYLARLSLVEALYRAWTISTGHPYHRA